MLQYVSEYVLAACMKHLAAEWTKSRGVGGREDGGALTLQMIQSME